MGLPCCNSSRLAWLGGGFLAVASATALGLLAWSWRTPAGTPVSVDPGQTSRRESVPVPEVPFTDITRGAGIRFTHHSGSFGKKLLPETLGSGVAVIDFDGDGKPDILFVNSCDWPGHESSGPWPTPHLYRNLGGGQFKDVTADVGLDVTLYGMGVTVGDYDNDRYPDLFITGVGGNRLFRNTEAPPGKGVNGRIFKDVTRTARVGGPGGWPADGTSPRVDPGLKTGARGFLDRDRPLCFSTSAAFLDYDGDGLLDLFVCNYVTWSPAYDIKQGFKIDGIGRAFGPPRAFEGSQCLLYRNRGDGTFEDVSRTAGVQVFEKEGTEEDAPLRSVAKSLGVIVCDLDDDGWPDLVVANDTVRNFFFHNEPDPKDGGKRVFKEMGDLTGIAYATGEARGAMGIDWGPLYRPNKSALLIGNFSDEPDTFLCSSNPRSLFFADEAVAEGLAGPSRPLLKFGVFFFDYDLDGRPDILTCNGQLEPEIGKLKTSATYAQPPQLFWNTGLKGRGFEPVTARDAGPDLFRPLVGRGCAYADLHGTGRLDVILTANGGPARVLRNDGRTGNHWVRLKLEGDGRHCNRSAIGARVTLEAGGVVQRREVAAARGYLSQSELAVTFGLGKLTTIDRVTIQWPGRNPGPPTVLTDLAIDKEHHVAQKPGA